MAEVKMTNARGEYFSQFVELPSRKNLSVLEEAFPFGGFTCFVVDFILNRRTV